MRLAIALGVRNSCLGILWKLHKNVRGRGVTEPRPWAKKGTQRSGHERLLAVMSLKFLPAASLRRRNLRSISAFVNLFSKHASSNNVLAIRREESTVWERRAPINPSHVETLIRKGVKVLVQPSTRRAYSIPEYERAGAIITDEIEEANVIIGMFILLGC